MRHMAILLLCAASALAEPATLQPGDRIDAIEGADAPLDLRAAAALTLGGNPQLAQEREGVAELEARVVQARATAFPRIDLSGSYSRGRDPSFALDAFFSEGSGFVIDPGAIPAQSFWRSSIDASWELRPLKVGYALSAAKAALHEQEHLVADVENRTLESLIAAYQRVVLEQETLRALESEIEAKREFLAVTRRRFQLDLAAPLDTLQAAVSLANLDPAHRRQQRALRAAGENLNLLMGRDPLTPLAIVVELDVENDGPDVETALELAKNHPDLERAESATQFLRRRRKVQKSDVMPYFTLESSYGYVGRTADTVFENGHDTWRTAVTLKLPLWDGFTTKGQVRETEALLRRSEFEESETAQRLRADILGAHDDWQTARASLAAAELNLRMAEEARRQTARRYELGKAGHLDVLNADADRLTARGNLVQARYEVQTAAASLKRAMGVSPLESFADILSQSRGVAP